MLCGRIEKLEDILERYIGDDDYVGREDVLRVIGESAAAGDCWQVPVDVVPDGMNETDFENGQVLGRVPACVKKTLVSEKNELFFCAFTSPDRVSAGSSEEPVMSISYPALDLLQEFADSDFADGMLLNPWSQGLRISHEDVKEILDNLKAAGKPDFNALHSYRIKPRAVIDADNIIEEWGEGWDKDDDQEKWRLLRYSIMADGRILLLFEMRDEVLCGKRTDSGPKNCISHYRVLEYEIHDDGPVVTGRYRTAVENAHIGSFYIYDGKLNFMLRGNDENVYSVFTIIPTDDDGQFKIFSNIQDVITDSRHNVIVAYENNQYDKCKIPLMMFSEDGEVIWRCRDEDALACSAITLGNEENIWYHMRPSNLVMERDAENGLITSHEVSLQGFNAMALTSDKTRMAAVFSESGGGSVFYVLSRDECGNYTSPIKLDLLGDGSDGRALNIEDCEYFGKVLALKSWLLINTDGKLYLYNIDDC